MERREFLKSVGLLGTGAAGAKVLDSDNPEFKNSEPEVLFEGGDSKFELVDSHSEAVQQESLLKGNAILSNKTDREMQGEFQTYFLGTLEGGEKYGFQASTEVQLFKPDSTEEVSVSTELTGKEFELKEYIVVFIRER